MAASAARAQGRGGRCEGRQATGAPARLVQPPTEPRGGAAALSRPVAAMGKRVAVVLAGCGVFDGSEIHEASAALVHLSRGGAEVGARRPHRRGSSSAPRAGRGEGCLAWGLGAPQSRPWVRSKEQSSRAAPLESFKWGGVELDPLSECFWGSQALALAWACQFVLW